MIKKRGITIALIDDNWAGHHPTYFKHLAKTFLELDCKVVAFCPNPDEVSEWVFNACPNLFKKTYCFKNQPSFTKLFPQFLRFQKSLTVLRRWQLATKAIQFQFANSKKSS